MLKVLKPLGISKVYGASRTDAHVRASSTIIEMEYEGCTRICQLVDSIPGIFVAGYAKSNDLIKLRGNLQKSYIFIRIGKLDRKILEAAIKQFMSSNFSMFSRRPEKKVDLRNIKCKVTRTHTLLLFIGKSFSWNFVRISAETIIMRATGKIDDDEWNMLLEGTKKYRHRGSAENLILISTYLPVQFEKYESRSLEYQRSRILADLYWFLGIDSHLSKDIFDSINFAIESGREIS